MEKKAKYREKLTRKRDAITQKKNESSSAAFDPCCVLLYASRHIADTQQIIEEKSLSLHASLNGKNNEPKFGVFYHFTIVIMRVNTRRIERETVIEQKKNACDSRGS